VLDTGDLRTKAVTFAIEECEREGLVNNEVILRLVQCCPAKLESQLLETTTATLFNDQKSQSV
jgi:hypothetical protein